MAHVGLPAVSAAGRNHGKPKPADPGKFPAIELGPTTSLVNEAIQLAELNQTDGPLHVGHTVVEPHAMVDVRIQGLQLQQP